MVTAAKIDIIRLINGMYKTHGTAIHPNTTPTINPTKQRSKISLILTSSVMICTYRFFELFATLFTKM